MSDLLSRGVAAGAGRLVAGAGRPVTYYRETTPVELTAVPGGGLNEAADQDADMRLGYTERDWIIEAVKLVIGGLHSLPHDGDRVVEAAGDKTYTWEVMTPSGRELPFRLDATRGLMRIHTKLVKTE